MKVKHLKNFPKVEVVSEKEKPVNTAFANGFNLARTIIGEIIIPIKEEDFK